MDYLQDNRLKEFICNQAHIIDLNQKNINYKIHFIFTTEYEKIHIVLK